MSQDLISELERFVRGILGGPKPHHERTIVAAIDDLTAAATRLETATSNLISALHAATPDLQPVTDGLNAAAQSAEDTLNPPAPAPVEPPA